MKLKVPPALVFFIFGLFMFLLAKFLPVGYFDFFGRHYFSIFLSLLAVAVAILALVKFFKMKTTIDPTEPAKTTRLVVNGIYTYSRNPMYLGLLLLLLAWGVWLGNAFNTLLAAGFVAYMNRYQIVPEEEALANMFGKEYKQYCIKVRRWF